MTFSGPVIVREFPCDVGDMMLHACTDVYCPACNVLRGLNACDDKCGGYVLIESHCHCSMSRLVYSGIGVHQTRYIV